MNYIYDNVGNVKSINDTINSIKLLMMYDNLDRLTRTIRQQNEYRKFSHNYTYDSIGNIMNITKEGFDDVFYDYNGTRPKHMPYRVRIVEI